MRAHSLGAVTLHRQRCRAVLLEVANMFLPEIPLPELDGPPRDHSLDVVIDRARSSGAATRLQFDELLHTSAAWQEILGTGEQIVVLDGRQKREIRRGLDVFGSNFERAHDTPVPRNVIVRETNDRLHSIVAAFRHLVIAELDVPRLPQDPRKKEGKLHRWSPRLLDCWIHGTNLWHGDSVRYVSFKIREAAGRRRGPCRSAFARAPMDTRSISRPPPIRRKSTAGSPVRSSPLIELLASKPHLAEDWLKATSGPNVRERPSHLTGGAMGSITRREFLAAGAVAGVAAGTVGPTAAARAA